MTNLEKALYLAAKAFVTSFDMDKQVAQMQTTFADGPPPEYEQQERAALQHPTPASNGIPVCQRHGKPMKSGQYGYYCTSKESDPRFANKNGYCNSRG